MHCTVKVLNEVLFSESPILKYLANMLETRKCLEHFLYFPCTIVQSFDRNYYFLLLFQPITSLLSMKDEQKVGVST